MKPVFYCFLFLLMKASSSFTPSARLNRYSFKQPLETKKESGKIELNQIKRNLKQEEKRKLDLVEDINQALSEIKNYDNNSNEKVRGNSYDQTKIIEGQDVQSIKRIQRSSKTKAFDIAEPTGTNSVVQNNLQIKGKTNIFIESQKKSKMKDFMENVDYQKIAHIDQNPDKNFKEIIIDRVGEENMDNFTLSDQEVMVHSNLKKEIEKVLPSQNLPAQITINNQNPSITVTPIQQNHIPVITHTAVHHQAVPFVAPHHIIEQQNLQPMPGYNPFFSPFMPPMMIPPGGFEEARPINETSSPTTKQQKKHQPSPAISSEAQNQGNLEKLKKKLESEADERIKSETDKIVGKNQKEFDLWKESEGFKYKDLLQKEKQINQEKDQEIESIKGREKKQEEDFKLKEKDLQNQSEKEISNQKQQGLEDMDKIIESEKEKLQLEKDKEIEEVKKKDKDYLDEQIKLKEQDMKKDIDQEIKANNKAQEKLLKNQLQEQKEKYEKMIKDLKIESGKNQGGKKPEFPDEKAKMDSYKEIAKKLVNLLHLHERMHKIQSGELDEAEELKAKEKEILQSQLDKEHENLEYLKSNKAKPEDLLKTDEVILASENERKLRQTNLMKHRFVKRRKASRFKFGTVHKKFNALKNYYGKKGFIDKRDPRLRSYFYKLYPNLKRSHYLNLKSRNLTNSMSFKKHSFLKMKPRARFLQENTSDFNLV